ncbi:MAG: hypothetical protein EON54_05545 [Alcaligenaceae bacterium]|nr:MAG: hypothetical protein EON54_05545 [Alcaligenaceae bacterium]
MKKLALQLSAITLVCAALVGCGKKPPECAAPEVLGTMQSILVDNVQNRPQPTAPTMADLAGGDVQKMLRIAMADLLRDDPQGIQGRYLKDLKLNLANIVSDGYNEQARKNTCRAHLTIGTASGQSLSREVKFTTQVSESKDQDYVLEVQEFQPFVDAVVNDMTGYYSAKRLQGEWSGTYACGGIDGAASGAQGPYQMPVAVTVDKQFSAKLERTTRGGGVEVLQGRVNQYTGELELRGQGQNSPDDIWNTNFKGKVRGLELGATGQVATPEGRTLRQCRLTLKLG